MTAQATAPAASGHSMGEEVSTSSPYSVHGGGPSSSTPVSHNFNIDSFDFGADFSLPSSLDDLAIFHNHNGTVNVQNSSSASQAGGSQASPIQGSSFDHGQKPSISRSKSHNANASGNRSSNNSVAGSPRSNQYSSPRISMREQVLHQVANSRHQSPHAFPAMNHADGTDLTGTSSAISVNGGGSTDGSNASNGGGNNNAMGYDSGLSLDPNDLQGLLQSINASSLSQQEHQQQIQDGNLSISELQKLLTEKEQMERVQSIQTAFLRQQLEALQRQSANPHNEGSSHQQQSQSMTASALSASQLMQQFQQLSSQQQPSPQGRGNPIFSPPFPQLSSSATGSMPSHNAYLSQSKPGQTMGMSVAMNQYGLITPASSSAFSQNGRGQAPFVSPLHIPGSSQLQHMMDPQRSMAEANIMAGSFTPLESPAITPASVFSNVGSTATSADLFSPLTSPALHPQMHTHDGMIAMQLSPFHGPTQMKGRGKGRGGIPGASPNTNPTKSIPRKNRSTTAEARANRARASPIVKPTVSTSTSSTQTRKRGESASGSMASPLGPNVPIVSGNNSRNGSAPTSRRTSQSESNDGKQTPQAFPPLSAGSGSAKPMDASPSETANSTPSPIEMPPPNGKPMTPSSAMGIQSNQKKTGKGEDSKMNTNGKGRSNKSSNESGNGKQVSFADSSSGSLQNILPGGLSSQDRDSWASTMKSSGGGGLESRRTSHKAAEQKRRDSLKFCFDELRGMLPAITLDDDVPGGSMLGPDGYIEDQDAEGFGLEEVGDAESARIANRAISKVALLRHSNEYLIRLKHRMGRRDRDLALCRREIMELRSRLGLPIPPEMPALTASIAGAAASMGHNMNVLLGLDQMVDPSQNPHQAAIVAALQQHMQDQQNTPIFQSDQLTSFSHVMGNSNSMDMSS